MFLFVVPPFVVGVSATKVDTKAGVKVWSDLTYTISQVPSFLQGSVLFQVAHWGIDSGTDIKVEGKQQASVYIALDTDSDESGGFASSLSKQGWALMTGEVRYADTARSSYQLDNIWRKTIMDQTFLSFTTTKENLTLSIFVGKFVYTKNLPPPHINSQYYNMFTNLSNLFPL